MMKHGTVSSVRGLRLKIEAIVWRSCVLVTHGAVFVDENNGVGLA